MERDILQRITVDGGEEQPQRKSRWLLVLALGLWLVLILVIGLGSLGMGLVLGLSLRMGLTLGLGLAVGVGLVLGLRLILGQMRLGALLFLALELKSSQTQQFTNTPKAMSFTHSTAQNLTSWYPPTMPQHLCDALAVDVEEACAEAMEKGILWLCLVYVHEMSKLLYEIAYEWYIYGSTQVKRLIMRSG